MALRSSPVPRGGIGGVVEEEVEAPKREGGGGNDASYTFPSLGVGA